MFEGARQVLKWASFVLAMGALALGSCKPTGDVRFRVAVTVEGQGAPKTFSRVWRWYLSKAPIPLVAPYAGGVIAEAVPIPIAGRPTLYALTVGGRGGSLGNLPELVFGPLLPPSISRSDRLAGMRAISAVQGQPQVVPCDVDQSFCPRFVYLDDESDPSTVHVVDPTHLPTIYRGVSIRSVTVTIVDERPSHSGLIVPAFQRNPRWSEWYQRLDWNDPRKLGPEAFRTDARNPA